MKKSLLILTGFAALTLVGCSTDEDDGKFEKAGRAIDEQIEDLQDKAKNFQDSVNEKYEKFKEQTTPKDDQSTFEDTGKYLDDKITDTKEKARKFRESVAETLDKLKKQTETTTQSATQTPSDTGTSTKDTGTSTNN